MINVPAGARVLLATRPIDFRKGAHSLAVLAQEALAEDPFSGAVIVYRAKRSDRLKILVWDSSGLVLVWNTWFHTESLSLWPNHFGEVACWSAAARSTRRFHRLHCLTGVCATGGVYR